MTVISDIIEEHAEEAAFLWLRRDYALGEPHYSLEDLANLDERVEANLDGLRIAGDTGWQICVEALAIQEPGEVFAAAFLALESQKTDRVDVVLAAVEEDPLLQRAFVAAMAWMAFDHIYALATKLLAADAPFKKRMGLAAFAAHRRDPGEVLAQVVAHEDIALRARALKACGELGRADLLPSVFEGLKDSDAHCRFHAAFSAALMGELYPVKILKEIAAEPSPYQGAACNMALRAMDLADAQVWLADLRSQPDCHRAAITGYGILGDPANIPWLIEAMQDVEVARLAGESLSMITGLDLEHEQLEADAPAGFESGPSEDPDDEDVAEDPDENLPWPDTAKLTSWWQQNETTYGVGIRHLCGRPISEEHCSDVLKWGYQRQRNSAAIELMMVKKGGTLSETRATAVFSSGASKWEGR
jgi:uncharacterized protein (TIGR02270 family)